MTANIKLDFRSACLFRKRSVATNLVTSLDFDPIRCAAMLCHFGQTRNDSVAPQFLLLSSTAMSSTKGGYVVVPERFGQNEEPVSSDEEQS